MNYREIINTISKFNKFIENNKIISYNLLEAILRVIDIELCNLPKYEIKNNVNIFRIKLANDLIVKKIYKNFPNILKNEKNDIYTILVHNEPIDENTLKYISIYFNLNIIIIHKNKYRCVCEYNKNINSIFLLEHTKTRYVPIYYINKNDNKIFHIFSDTDVLEITSNFILDNRLVFNNKIQLSDKDYKKINKLKTYTLGKLQELCIEYNIPIHKYISDRKLLKKKNDLFDELKLKLTY